LKFELAVIAPFGLNSQYRNDRIGRYQAIKSNIETTNVNPNIVYRVSDWLSIGGGPAIQYATAELTNAINSTTVARRANRLLPAGLTRPERLYPSHRDSLSVGYNLGAFAEISPRTRFGASYRSQVSHRLDGTAILRVPAPLSADQRFQNTPTGTDLNTPDIVSLAASHEISADLTLTAEIQWTNGSAARNLRVERPYGSALIHQREHARNMVRQRGASYGADQKWIIRGGFAFDPTPIPNQFRTARLPDAKRDWLALGIGYKSRVDLRFDAANVHNLPRKCANRRVWSTGDLIVGCGAATLRCE